MDIFKIRLWVAAAILIFFFGCQHAAIAYRLRRDGLNPIVLPPTPVDETSQSLSITVPHARHIAPREINCDIRGGLISLLWVKSNAQITFQSQSFFARDDQSSNQVARGLYVDPLLAIEKFRSELVGLESKGCLTAIEGERVRRAIVESLPFPPEIAYFLQLGSYDVSGYFDMTPDFRLQITSPIYAAGTQPSASTLTGYETANYMFTREGSRTRLRLSSATETPVGGTAIEQKTPRNELAFAKSPAYFRLMFMAEEGASRRVNRAILLSSLDQMKLAQATSRRAASAEEFCATLTDSQVSCTVFPKNFGVSPELHIRVNQKDAFVRLGGMVKEVLDLEDADAGPPPSLQILRPFRGHLIPIEFDRSSKDILNLVLLPGDQITY